MTTREAWNTAAVEVRPPIDDGDDTPGLVLVFCEAHQSMQPAYQLGADAITLGREPDNSIPISDHSASRYHAKVERRGDDFWVSDLGSTNGTLVDGSYIKEAPVPHGAILRVGDTLFKFLARGATPYQAYRIDGTRYPHLSPVERASDATALVGGYLIDRVCESIEKVAGSALSVVVTGGSGTGKELAAREIHRLSNRRGAFQAINCAAIPDNLIESELFGFRRGAFTGADRDKQGLVKAADGGTLFLDEVGDMPSEVQVKLLRAVQFGEIQPLGAPAPERVDLRIVAATHRNLQEEIDAGGFRGDLFARLNEFCIQLPPLVARKEDIYMLARHFVTKYGRPDADVPFAVMLALVHYDWPYNVRELESAIKRCLALSGGGGIEFAHLPDPVRDALRAYGQKPPPSPDSEETSAAMRPMRGQAPTLSELVELLQKHQGNISAIGREVGKERVQVHRWLKRFGLNADDYRP
jgi:DNA-binding NtrC family response regulator